MVTFTQDVDNGISNGEICTVTLTPGTYFLRVGGFNVLTPDTPPITTTLTAMNGLTFQAAGNNDPPPMVPTLSQWDLLRWQCPC